MNVRLLRGHVPRLLDLAVHAQVAEHDIPFALTPDRQGIGVVAGTNAAVDWARS